MDVRRDALLLHLSEKWLILFAFFEQQSHWDGEDLVQMGRVSKILGNQLILIPCADTGSCIREGSARRNDKMYQT